MGGSNGFKPSIISAVPDQGPYIGPDGPAKKKFIPMHNKMVIMQIVEDPTGNTTNAGLVMPDSVGWRTPKYLVISTGLRCEVVQPGDMVLIHIEKPMKKIRFDNDEVLQIHEDEICGVIPHDGLEEREKLRATFPKN